MTVLRKRRNIQFHEPGGANVRVISSVSPMHSETSIGSDVWTAANDIRHVRRTGAGYDGWRVTDNNFHFGIGEIPGQAGDGWIGYGGRRGEHWLWSRIADLGYMHWPTRTFQSLGGPNWDRNNLRRRYQSRQTGFSVTNEQELQHYKLAIWWDNLWPLIGAVDALYVINGNGVKPKITISRAARDWLATNFPPLTPANETYLGFLFDYDWSDIPRVQAGQRRFNPSSQDVDCSTKTVRIANSANEELGLMLPDKLFCDTDHPRDHRTVALSRRFWNDRSFTGIRVDELGALPPGDLAFDPSVGPITTTDDGEDQDSTTWAVDGFNNRQYIYWEDTVKTNNYENMGARFDMTGLPSSGTITQFDLVGEYADDQNRAGDYTFDITCDDAANSPAFSSTDMTSDIFDEKPDNVRTINGPVPATNPTNGDPFTWEIDGCGQDLVDNYTPTNVRVCAEVTSQSDANFISLSDSNNANADHTLEATWTVGGGAGTLIPPISQNYRNMHLR